MSVHTSRNVPITRGINSQTLPGLDAISVVERAAAAGFDAVELAGEVISSLTELEKALGATGLEMLGLCPTPAVHDWHLRWDAELERRLGEELETAARLGAGYYVMPFMKSGGDAASVDAGLTRAARLAASLGVRLAVEPIGHNEPLNRAQQVAPLLEKQDPERVGLLLDSFHFFRAANTLDDLLLYDQVPILALQVSNSNGLPLDELLGYRDRTFPLDGPFQVSELCEHVLSFRPDVPIVVEVIGEVAAACSPSAGVERAKEQIDQIASGVTSKEPTGV